MFDLNNNTSKFNLPDYINIPFFLYQDNRLDKTSLLIAAFFYSLFTSGKKITASVDYLCQLSQIKKRRLYDIMNDLENYKYISRSGFTNRKKILWIYDPQSSITLVETETSAANCTSVKELNTSAVECSKLVQSSALNLCTPVHTDTKVNTKDYNKLTTVAQPQSSSSFFLKQKKELLALKLEQDSRTDELFLEECKDHIENQENNYSRFQRISGLKKLLKKLFDDKEFFQAKKSNNIPEQIKTKLKTPDEYDFKRYSDNEPSYEWVGEYIAAQFQLGKLNQEYLQLFSTGRKGYLWVGEWLEAKGFNKKQK